MTTITGKDGKEQSAPKRSHDQTERKFTPGETPIDPFPAMSWDEYKTQQQQATFTVPKKTKSTNKQPTKSFIVSRVTKQQPTKTNEKEGNEEEQPKWTITVSQS